MSDISIGGMFVDDLTSLHPGSIIRLKFSLPNLNETIVVTAEVRYVQKEIGAGVKFLDLKREFEEKIRELEESIFKLGNIPRRGPRLAVSIPTILEGIDRNGTSFKDRATIISLSRNGASVQTNRSLDIGTILSLYVPMGLELGFDFQARVVWVGNQATQTEGQIGIQCRGLAKTLGYNLPW